MGKIISFFNHKGGVGKTTLVYNLGFTLASKGKKVLLIDGDYQMNLTSSVFGLSDKIEYSYDNSQEWRDFLHNNTTLSEFLRNAITQNTKDIKLYKKEYIYKYKHSHRKSNCNPISIKKGDTLNFDAGGMLKLMPSNIGNKIAEVEIDLYNGITTNNSLIDPTLIQKRLKKLAQNYDFVLIDTSPSATSIINALLLMSSDYFIVPANPSFFSLQAVQNLQNIFVNWQNLLKSYMANFNQDGFKKPVFLGVAIVQARRMENRAEKNDGADHVQIWSDTLNNAVKDFNRDYSYGLQGAINEDKFKELFLNPNSPRYGTSVTPFIIQTCYAFAGELLSLSQKSSVPTSMLTNLISAEYPNEKNKGHAFAQVNWVESFTAFKEQIDNIVQALIKL